MKERKLFYGGREHHNDTRHTVNFDCLIHRKHYLTGIDLRHPNLVYFLEMKEFRKFGVYSLNKLKSELQCNLWRQSNLGQCTRGLGLAFVLPGVDNCFSAHSLVRPPQTL